MARSNGVMQGTGARLWANITSTVVAIINLIARSHFNVLSL